MARFLKISYCMTLLMFSSCNKALSPEDQTIIGQWQESPFAESLSITMKKLPHFSAHLEGFWSLLKPHSTCLYSAMPDWEETLSSEEPLFTLFAQVCGHQSRFYPLVATVTEEKGDFEVATKLLQHIHQTTLPTSLKDLLTEEALAKILAYRTCTVGQEFVISVKGDLVRYRIDCIFPMGGGIPAYGCIPSDNTGSPLLLFRGSEFSFNQRGRSTFKANLDLKGPAYSMYLSVRPQLQSWLEKQTTIFGKAKVLGFSLGGTLTAYAVVLDTKFFHTGVAFNMAGVRKKIAEQWEQIARQERPVFISYVNQGDAVSKIGTLFGNVYEFSFPSPLKLIKAHNILILSQSKVILKPVDVEKENRSSRLFSF